jgi:hypothetical protein
MSDYMVRCKIDGGKSFSFVITKEDLETLYIPIESDKEIIAFTHRWAEIGRRVLNHVAKSVQED